MPSDRIGGISPLTAFTGLPGTSQLRAVVGPTSVPSIDEATLQRHRQQTLVATRNALDTIHRAATATSDKRNTQHRQRRAQQQHVSLPRFEIGDFVLAAGVLSRRNKLALNWSGPKRVVASLNDFTFEVQDLTALFYITVHHASRLQFYRDSQRGVTQDLLDHVHYATGGHLVDKLLEVRHGPDDYEIKVQWIGLDPLEASWEPATVILEDVPKLDMWAAIGDGPLPTPKTTGKSHVTNRTTSWGK
ncbi:hypothetical protein PHYSODRAFT_314006 [Phytophthora sojae]|uniref:Chromo domain-containing protein n=1 Tax=Phytophthora sojae (strain P6497) TaxID=1094619 RepID=G4Z2T9_PHYSP|nr:hypothetical protein PHYSODRAFT_314006 [Phytophthora sojae]EGZ22213.1 hypothetical protein PHYSODRAFT_314006 [Phytophthora sojae]|eukprot:XP_009524930.1 hypothetical protein PHYSODRAFT_314006 [Phytophthora sojae]